MVGTKRNCVFVRNRAILASHFVVEAGQVREWNFALIEKFTEARKGRKEHEKFCGISSSAAVREGWNLWSGERAKGFLGSVGCIGFSFYFQNSSGGGTSVVRPLEKPAECGNGA